MPNSNSDLERVVGRRPRVVIGHPALGRGGSEACVMWLAEALKSDCDVTVVTTGGWDLPALNRYYGTSLAAGEVKVRLAPMPPVPAKLVGAALRGALLQRFARRIAREYDLRISAYGLIDWGVNAVHFIADFSWHPSIRREYDPPSPGLAYRDTLLRRAYLALARSCSAPSGRNIILDDHLIANSDWSANQLRPHYPFGKIPVVYPPVWSSFPNVPWSAKDDAFVMIGRIAPEKRIEAAIRVLQTLRRRGHNLRFYLCGDIPADAYGRTIRAQCEANREWIICHGLVSDSRKATLLAHCRYGIQMRSCEPFGISVAEMVKANAIVFAPNAGGQAEILQSEQLLFSDEADAVQKIEAVIRNPELQVALGRHTKKRALLFSAESFVRQARAALASVLVGEHSACAPSRLPKTNA